MTNTPQGYTPLRIAAMKGYVSVGAKLLAAGADTSGVSEAVLIRVGEWDARTGMIHLLEKIRLASEPALFGPTWSFK